MKNTLYFAILMVALLSLNTLSVVAQKTDSLLKLSAAQQKVLKSVSLGSYGAFKSSARPLLEKMAVNQIVGLGEGTHGTAEFYILRYYISRFLIEEKGFNHVGFEDDVAELWLLNEQLAKTDDVAGLMKKHLISIWQNKETMALLDWIKSYNQQHSKKVSIQGIDYPGQTADVEMMRILLGRAGVDAFDKRLSIMQEGAIQQDEAWSGMNRKDYKVDWKSLNRKSGAAYAVADTMMREIKALSIDKDIKSDLLRAVINIKQGFEPFYPGTKYVSRDSIMAYNTSLFVKSKSDKVILWAHDAHLGNKEIYGNSVGGTGKYLSRLFPGNYFVLGTGTGIGEFGAITDARSVKTSVTLPYTLEKPIAGSWEQLLGTAKKNSFYFYTANFKPDELVLPQRFVGFGVKSGVSLYDKVSLKDMYDAFLFINVTHAPTPL